ncbi:GDNF family receptor alpha-3 [Aplochiton taeniatus]
MDCLQEAQVCVRDPQCEALYQTLELCAADEADSQLGEQARGQCLEAQGALHPRYSPLLACKCLRGGGMREERCLRVYWSVRVFQGDEELEESPYKEFPMDTSRMASIVAASSATAPDGQNACLKAAQDCGLYEKCGALRSEYVLACTKRVPASSHCNRQRCHRLLRRFLERVPEEYSLGVLFCPCTHALCGERRRKTIVPSCSYQDRDGTPPNCLHLQSFCRRDELCRSRLADFLHQCQPSSPSSSGCLRESGAACLRAYAGLIGTIMTPNYVSNSSVDVSLWCNCEGSGNQWQDCLRIQHMFTNNPCLTNSIVSMGISGPLSVEGTSPPPPRPSPLVQQEELLNNALPEHNEVVESEETEDLQEEKEEEVKRHFNVIPLYSVKSTVSNLGSGATPASYLAPAPPPLLLLLLLLLSASLSWG